jgi:hypothetical protein
MSELDDGLSLAELMSRSPLSPSQVISVGLDVLTGLQALQQLGLSHGNLHPGNVHVSRRGRARLGDYALRPRFRPGSSRLGWPDPRADLAAAGALLCGALGVAPRSEGAELSQAERSVPALVAAVRVMAEGGAGRFAGAALGLFEEASGGRARQPQLDRSREELATLVRGEQPERRQPAAAVSNALPEPARAVVGARTAPAVPDRSIPAAVRQAPATRPAGPASGRYRNVRWLFLAATLSLLALTLGLVAAWVLLRPSPAASAQTRSTPAASTGPQTAAAPAVAPSGVPAQPSAAPAPGAAEAPVPGAAEAPVPGAAEAPVPAPAETPAPAAVDQAPAVAPVAAGADSPTGAVSQFYDRVVTHDFSGALGLWSPSMQSAYPPADNINSRFSNTTSMSVRRNDLMSAGGGRAVVAVDLVEIRGGRSYHWVGNWYLVQSGSGWLLDRPGLHAA